MWQSLFSWNHVHPALVHFTVALLPVSLVTDVIGKFTDRHSITSAAWWPLLYGAIAAPVTAIAGWMWASDLGPSAAGSLLATHRWLGLVLAITIPVLAIWRGRFFARSESPRVVYLALAIVVCLVLSYQGFTGGMMTVG